jgi:uncharacterized UBP type Zn finger protein
MYRYLSIDIADISAEQDGEEVVEQRTVEKSLEQFFRPEEREIKCEKCSDGIRATQTLRVLSRPKALLLHLKRFVVVEKPSIRHNNAENQSPNKLENNPPPVEMVVQKNKAPVILSEHLSLDPYFANSDQVAASQQYSIKSVVYHLGNTANSGHYTADALRPCPENVEGPASTKWISFDDGSTSVIPAKRVLQSVHKQSSAYMLLYTTD